MTTNTHRLATLTLRLLVSVLGFAAIGCGQKPVAHGTVTLDGQPIENGAIQFFPTSGEGQTAGATIQNGQYRTEVSPGPMKVVINAPKVVGKQKLYDEPNSPTADLFKEQLSPKYSSVNKSELTVTVEGVGGEFNFDLKSDKTTK